MGKVPPFAMGATVFGAPISAMGVRSNSWFPTVIASTPNCFRIASSGTSK